jgi:hypothetical protein
MTWERKILRKLWTEMWTRSMENKEQPRDTE